MRQFFKVRGEIFVVASVIGGSIAGVWFVYRPTETWNYFDVAYFHRIVLFLCVASSLLPTLVFYLILYLANILLVRIGGQDELKERKTKILTTLIEACVSSKVVEKSERDLIDEIAWSRLKPFWRRM